MRLLQLKKSNGSRGVGTPVGGDEINVFAGVHSLIELAHLAIAADQTLAEVATTLGVESVESYSAMFSEQRILPTIDHLDQTRTFVSGTGLTHTGSAKSRDAMHAKLSDESATLSDSMKIFKMGVDGGKPAAGETGVQPEWFWKGNGTILRGSGQTMESPHWADDFGEEPEIAGIYLVGEDRHPYRLGFSLANEMSDHVMERVNYLFLAHSKLRECALGPELLTGPLPSDVQGTSRIYRDGKELWARPFMSGEDNMTHTIANLEHHHFKYPLFCNPGDIHVHLFGTATLSFADGVRLQEGDEMEIDCPQFGHPLRNRVQTSHYPKPKVRSL